MRHPVHAGEHEADDPGDQGRAKLFERVEKGVVGEVGGHGDLEHQDRDDDREDAVCEGVHAVGTVASGLRGPGLGRHGHQGCPNVRGQSRTDERGDLPGTPRLSESEEP